MTCKDCLYEKVCYHIEHYGVDIDNKNAEIFCADFKDKTHFVEVVRCVDCKKRSNLTCEVWGLRTKMNDFCSYGERKEENNA